MLNHVHYSSKEYELTRFLPWLLSFCYEAVYREINLQDRLSGYHIENCLFKKENVANFWTGTVCLNCMFVLWLYYFSLTVENTKLIS